MLSYRHSFHAGNHADVIKHIVQQRILLHLLKKDKPVCYIDTHAGAGGYQLQSNEAQKNCEFDTGIGKLWQHSSRPEIITEYVELIQSFNTAEKLTKYPGSPWIASHLLRDIDKLFLHELHPKDFDVLRTYHARGRRSKVIKDDGFKGCLALTPPPQRRGLTLIDPPYEIKDDYKKVVDVVSKAYKKFATGIYAIWYPVVDRDRIYAMEHQLVNSGVKNIQLFELNVSEDTYEKGMTGSGMIVVNPPWTLKNEMEQTLPWLVETLADETGSYRCETLVDE